MTDPIAYSTPDDLHISSQIFDDGHVAKMKPNRFLVWSVFSRLTGLNGSFDVAVIQQKTGLNNQEVVRLIDWLKTHGYLAKIDPTGGEGLNNYRATAPGAP